MVGLFTVELPSQLENDGTNLLFKVDEQTVFASLIGNEEFLRRDKVGHTQNVNRMTHFFFLKVPLYPRELMKWTEGFYQPVFGELPQFRLEETDYVFGDRKFGGNVPHILLASVD